MGPELSMFLPQYLFCIQRLPAGYPRSRLLVMDDNGGSCPIPVLSSIIKVGSANAGCLFFRL